jgi:hypothetical protein
MDLINQKKYTIPGAREFLTNRDNRQRENAKYITKLTKLKKFLEKMRADLDKPQEVPEENNTNL